MSERLTGTATFVFTDVEGSTRLLKLLRERYGEVLADHQRLLRSAFEQNGGSIIDTQGDAFFVAFPRPRDALLGTIAGQRALAEHDWPDGAEVRVRMGIDTGEAEMVDGRYTGLAVHRAARISAAAHGGQVLVSRTTHNLLEDEEKDGRGVGLRDLGQHALKDLARPVRLYQVVAPGLRRNFPPPGKRDEPHAQRGWTHRRLVITAIVSLLAAAGALAAALAFRDDSENERPIAVPANSLVRIDAQTSEPTDVFPAVREAPVAAAFAGRDGWVVNLDSKDALARRPRNGVGGAHRRHPAAFRRRGGPRARGLGRARRLAEAPSPGRCRPRPR